MEPATSKSFVTMSISHLSLQSRMYVFWTTLFRLSSFVLCPAASQGKPQVSPSFRNILLLEFPSQSGESFQGIGLSTVCWGKPADNIPAYVLFMPDGPCLPYQTRLLFARQAGYVSFTTVSSDQYLFFSMNYRKTQNQCTALLPAAKWCLVAYPCWILNWLFMVSFDGFHKDHEGLIISFFLKTLSNLRQVK